MSVIKKEIWRNHPVEVQHSSDEVFWEIYIRQEKSSDKMITLTLGELVVLAETLKEIIKQKEGE